MLRNILRGVVCTLPSVTLSRIRVPCGTKMHDLLRMSSTLDWRRGHHAVYHRSTTTTFSDRYTFISSGSALKNARVFLKTHQQQLCEFDNFRASICAHKKSADAVGAPTWRARLQNEGSIRPRRKHVSVCAYGADYVLRTDLLARVSLLALVCCRG